VGILSIPRAIPQHQEAKPKQDESQKRNNDDGHRVVVVDKGHDTTYQLKTWSSFFSLRSVSCYHHRGGTVTTVELTYLSIPVLKPTTRQRREIRGRREGGRRG